MEMETGDRRLETGRGSAAIVIIGDFVRSSCVTFVGVNSVVLRSAAMTVAQHERSHANVICAEEGTASS